MRKMVFVLKTIVKPLYKYHVKVTNASYTGYCREGIKDSKNYERGEFQMKESRLFRIISMVLSFMLVMTMLPFSALAEGENGDPGELLGAQSIEPHNIYGRIQGLERYSD
jgi:hypothetical protein